MELRRGFKTEANKLARELRQELGLAVEAALCPRVLADHLDIPLIALSSLQNTVPVHVEYLFTAKGRNEFSAATLFEGRRRVILYNDAHSPKRQASDLMHELAHALLHHPCHPLLDPSGVRTYNDPIEKEANWLGPALLISEEAAMHIALKGLSVAAASDMYGATEKIVSMRLNVTSAFMRAKRRKAA